MSEASPQVPKVGVGVLVFKDGKLLLGKRKNSHGEGSYASPGGHLEYMESFEDAVRRETREETGIEIDNIRFLCLTNLKAYAPKHYIDIGFVADWKSGKPELREPECFESWDWYDPDHLPEPLFATIRTYLESLRLQTYYYDN